MPHTDHHRHDHDDRSRKDGPPASDTVRTGGPAGDGTRGARPAASARRALRREAPSTVALLADHDDFHAMRSYTTFVFDDHARYLRQAHGMLRTLASRGTYVSVVRFDPAQYAAYCADTGQDPDSADTRTHYVAEVASGGAAVPYQGQTVDRLLEQLAGATDRHATWQHATETLIASGNAQAAFDRATLAFTRLLESAGSGSHHLVCSVPLDNVPLAAAVQAERDADGTVHLAETDALVLCTLLAAAIATGGPGGLVLRTGDGTPAAPDHVRGWTLRDGWPHPLTEAQVFDAYCTDAGTGDPVPPEPGVTYCAGTDLPPPR
jgi:hypothetical protein